MRLYIICLYLYYSTVQSISKKSFSFCSDIILDFVWALATAERVEQDDAEGKMSWLKHVTQPVNSVCFASRVMVIKQYECSTGKRDLSV